MSLSTDSILVRRGVENSLAKEAEDATWGRRDGIGMKAVGPYRPEESGGVPPVYVSPSKTAFGFIFMALFGMFKRGGTGLELLCSSGEARMTEPELPCSSL